MTKLRCRGCGVELTDSNNSNAHLIPRALGGRLASRGIICRVCNTALDKAADNALVKAFGAWPVLMGIPIQGGGHAPKTVETNKGQSVLVEPDGSLTRTDIVFDVTPVPDGHAVTIGAGNIKTIRQLIQKAKKQFPELDVSAAEKFAQTIDLEPDSELKLGFDFSPQATFGGVITAIWLFLILKTGRAFMDWDRLLDCIRKMQKAGGTFRYLTDGLPGLNGPNIDLGHKIIVRSVPRSGELIAYVEILGVLKIGGLFADAGGPSELVEHIYAYDVVQKRDRSEEFSIDAVEFEKQNWRSVGVGPNDPKTLKEHFNDTLAVFTNHYKNRFSAESKA